MTKKLLISRLGAGTITVALCAVLPGCNLGVMPEPNDCVGHPASRGMSTADCPDAQAGDTAPDTHGGAGADSRAPGDGG